MTRPAVHGRGGLGLLQDGRLTAMLTSAVIVFMLTATVPRTSAQLHTAGSRTTASQRTTPVYRPNKPTTLVPPDNRRTTTKIVALPSRPHTTASVVSPVATTVIVTQAATVSTRRTAETRPAQSPTPTPLPPVVTTLSTVDVVGNLTGANICPRSVIETRYIWKDLKFECDRKEYVHCVHCPGCRFWNGTHCIRELKGECMAKVYQYEPVTVSVQHCCEGYERLGTVCIESVHCQDNNGGCPHICRSYKEAGKHCECYAGFHLNSSRCDDFDECTQKNGGCSDQCVNTIGSYYCKCNRTRQLVSPFKCDNVDACKTNNGGCDHICKNRDGTHYCVCNPGFKLIDGRECLDINECKMKYPPCAHKCKNRIGSFICICPPGETLNEDNRTCTGSNVINIDGMSGKNIGAGDVLSSPVMIGTVVAVAILLLLVTSIWIICCYVTGACCCQKDDAREERYRRKKRDDSQNMIVLQSMHSNKDNGHVNPGYINDTPPAYESETPDGYDTNALTPNGMHDRGEVSVDMADIHISPTFGHNADGMGNSDTSVQNGVNERRGDL